MSEARRAFILHLFLLSPSLMLQLCAALMENLCIASLTLSHLMQELIDCLLSTLSDVGVYVHENMEVLTYSMLSCKPGLSTLLLFVQIFLHEGS